MTIHKPEKMFLNFSVKQNIIEPIFDLWVLVP